MQKKRRTSSSYVIVSPRRSKKEKKQVGWSVSLRKRRTEKPIESRRKKKQECVFSIIGKYRLLFWGNLSFVVNILIFYSLVVSISNLLSFASSEVATDDLLALSLCLYLPAATAVIFLHRYIFPPFWVLLFFLRYLPTKFTF